MTVIESTPYPHFPGAVGISHLEVYDTLAPDNLRGGSPHLHTVCTEAYVILSGAGRLQTLSRRGFDEVTLNPGDIVWFGPGTVHRAINDNGLNALVIMQNAGLPEAGDAVLTFPDEDLSDGLTYDAQAALTGNSTVERLRQAQLRRDRAVEGFTQLVASWNAGDATPFERFLRRAEDLVQDRISTWPEIVTEGPLADAQAALDTIQQLRHGTRALHLDGYVAKISRPGDERPGMCGALLAYDLVRTGRVNPTNASASRCDD